MFTELSIPRQEQTHPAYLDKWFVVTDDFDGFLTHSLFRGLQVVELDKDNLGIFFWDSELNALRDVELWYDAHNQDFPFVDELQLLENNGSAAPPKQHLSEVMEFE